MGKRLKDLRVKAGLSQEGLARKANISTASVFRIEQGRPTDPTLSTLVALAWALDVPVGELTEELIRGTKPGPKKEK